MQICILVLLVTSITSSSIQRSTELLSLTSVDIFDEEQEKGEERLRIFDSNLPQPHDVRRTLKSWPKEAIADRFRGIIKEQIRELRASALFKLLHGKRGMDLVFDKTEVPFYGEDDSLTSYSRGRGASQRCFIYLTLQIVCPGLRLMLDSVPVYTDSKVGKMMQKMLKNARKQGIPIRSVFLDRGFYTVEALQQLKQYPDLEKVVLPVIRHQGIKNRIQDWYEKNGYTPGTLDLKLGGDRQGVEYILIFRPLTDEEKAKRWNDKNKRWKKREKDKDGKELAYQDFIYFCLLKPPETGSDSLLTVFNKLMLEFRRRWGIETGYRVVKGVWGWTTSTSYELRQWLMWIAILVYNLWVIENLKLIDEDLHKLPADYICCHSPTAVEVNEDEERRRTKHLPKSMRSRDQLLIRAWTPQPIEPMRYLCDILIEMAKKLVKNLIYGGSASSASSASSGNSLTFGNSGYDPPPDIEVGTVGIPIR